MSRWLPIRCVLLFRAELGADPRTTEQTLTFNELERLDKFAPEDYKAVIIDEVRTFRFVVLARVLKLNILS